MEVQDFNFTHLTDDQLTELAAPFIEFMMNAGADDMPQFVVPPAIMAIMQFVYTAFTRELIARGIPDNDDDAPYIPVYIPILPADDPDDYGYSDDDETEPLPAPIETELDAIWFAWCDDEDDADAEAGDAKAGTS